MANAKKTILSSVSCITAIIKANLFGPVKNVPSTEINFRFFKKKYFAAFQLPKNLLNFSIFFSNIEISSFNKNYLQKPVINSKGFLQPFLHFKIMKPYMKYFLKFLFQKNFERYQQCH
jgi:hypothetical protein